MKILSLSGNYYCKADVSFAFTELEKRISDTLHLRKNSFAEVYTKRIFLSFFQYAIDLKKEYTDYYLQEYDTFTDYLYKKELLDKEDIVAMDISGDQTVLKLNMNLNSYNADSLIDYEENGLDIINQALQEIGL